MSGLPSRVHTTSIYEAWRLVEDLRERWGWVLQVDARKLYFSKPGHRVSALHEDGSAQSVATAISRAHDKALALESASPPHQARATASPPILRRPARGEARIILVSCAKTKVAERTHAATLYDSPLFRKMRDYAEQSGRIWYILSALHGLVHPNEILSPYDHTLSNFSSEEKKEWAARIESQLCLRYPPPALVEIHAGEAYAALLEQALQARGFRVLTPLRGLRMGERLQWYNRRASPAR